jgi:signal transduction histidine kinase
VIRNLAENAERHARSTVSFGLAERDGRAVLTVTDDGPGIDAADSARIFERFTRLDSARTPERGGAGLGLAIVDEIVRRHRGTVQVDPDHSPGTCFVVTLPQSG